MHWGYAYNLSLSAIKPQNNMPAATLTVAQLIQQADQLQSAGKLQQAVDLYNDWLAVHGEEPQAAPVYFNHGILNQLNQPAIAKASYQKAQALNPMLYQAAVNLGLMTEASGDDAQALQIWNQALSDQLPVEGQCMLLNHMGRLHENLKRYPEAEAALERSLRLNPQQADVVQHFVGIRRRQCRWPSIPNWLREARPGEDLARDIGPFMAMAEFDTPERQRQAAQGFVERKRSPITPLPSVRWQHDKLRIGYFSVDFKLHAVSILMAEVLELHDRSRVQVYGLDYSDTTPSAMRQRVLKAFDHHVPLHALTDAQAALRIRELEIDVLIDLTGLTSGSRFDVLAYRAAPVQASYLGYMGSCAIPGVDYILADRHLMPPELTQHFTEKPIYLNSYQANDRQRVIGTAPTRAECGLPVKAFVFCAFNNNYKFTPDVWATWMRILKRSPNSVLWVLEDNPQAKENLTANAKNQGIAANRLIFAGRVMPEQYLARYHCADLFLDTAPYGAGTTASDALWAGLPVLTCPGQTMVSRMAGSLLHAVGLPELVTDSAQDYENLAVQLATKPKKIQAIKQRLKAQRDLCDLFNTPKFVRNLEDALIDTRQQVQNSPLPVTPNPLATAQHTPTAPVRIFSIAWSDDTLKTAQASGYEVMDNRANLRPDWYEYWPIRNFLLNQTLDENTYYGFFSSKFADKTQLPAPEVFKFIQQASAKGANVVLFSPQPDQGAGFLNVFEQQEVYSPGFIATSEAFLKEMGLDLALRTTVMDSRNTVFSNYFVARPAFWREWLRFGEALFKMAEAGNTPLAQALGQATHYQGGVQIKVFLMERLASLLLALYPYHFKTAAANPWTMAWSMTRFRSFPQEMVISDALKIAMREQGFPEYTAAFAAIRQQITQKV
jgi:predicted O-linked N-acetylglucosamine transferase (SPINDLY family)